MVQFSSVNGFITHDFDGDGQEEVLAAGNFFAFKPQIGMSDASMGTILQYSNGSLFPKHGAIAPLWLNGDIRDMALITFKNGEKRIVVSRNNDRPGVYAITL